MFLDSSVFILHASEGAADCRRLLERCEAGELSGVTSALVLAEVTHRLMMMEAVADHLVTSGKAVAKSKARPELVRRLRKYDEFVAAIPLMGVDVVPLDLAVLLRAADVRRRTGLLTNDSIVVAAAETSGAAILATADSDFHSLTHLKIVRVGGGGELSS